jgi:TonB family protein
MLIGCAILRAQVVPERQAVPPETPDVLLAKLKADPDDVTARLQLMKTYWRTGDKAAFLQQMLWLIENRPESPILAAALPVADLDAADYSLAKAAWEGQLSKRSDSPAVLYNAARFMEANDPLRSVDLLEQARKLAASARLATQYARAEGSIFAKSAPRNNLGNPVFPLSLEKAEALKARLLASSDAELLSLAGRMMATSMPGEETRKLGMQLMERATLLDPQNPKWQQNLEAVKNPPVSNAPPGAVRIGGAVAEANLIEKVEPVYPPLAKSARVSGTVEFTAVINEDGVVQNLQLIRGHPLLVNAAKEAVLQWKYRPTVLNGQPVAVVTSVVVNFVLKRE